MPTDVGFWNEFKIVGFLMPCLNKLICSLFLFTCWGKGRWSIFYYTFSKFICMYLNFKFNVTLLSFWEWTCSVRSINQQPPVVVGKHKFQTLDPQPLELIPMIWQLKMIVENSWFENNHKENEKSLKKRFYMGWTGQVSVIVRGWNAPCSLYSKHHAIVSTWDVSKWKLWRYYLEDKWG